MTFQQIHYVIQIAETGSLNQAAKKLFVSQPALTGALQSLEEELGISIFQRSRQGMTLTNEGEDFLMYARQLDQQYELLLDRYREGAQRRQKFGVSCQHYTFAVRAFSDMVREFDALNFDFAIRETRTREVILDVGQSRSEIGILYLSDFNRKILQKLLHEEDLEFHPLVEAEANVYLSEKHPLAGEPSVSFSQLKDYPCLSFEQDQQSSIYLAEEILIENEYPRMIHVTDRATMLNLMDSLNGYTLCSGIICSEYNGGGYVSVPFREDAENKNSRMTIGYIAKRGSIRSKPGEYYLTACRRELKRLEGC